MQYVIANREVIGIVLRAEFMRTIRTNNIGTTPGHEHLERVVDAAPDVLLLIQLAALRNLSLQALRQFAAAVNLRLLQAVLLDQELVGDVVVRREQFLFDLPRHPDREVPKPPRFFVSSGATADGVSRTVRPAVSFGSSC